ncbi:Phosphopantetheine adenylyltransferase [Dirofilaria immitis]
MFGLIFCSRILLILLRIGYFRNCFYSGLVSHHINVSHLLIIRCLFLRFFDPIILSVVQSDIAGNIQKNPRAVYFESDK